MLLRILNKILFDYGNDWKAHLADVLWAYRSSPKTATGFTPFSLVYSIDTISPTELVVPSPRVMQESELEVDASVEAHFFCQQQTKPKTSEICLKARNPLGPVICRSRRIRENDFKPLIKLIPGQPI